MRGFQHEGEGIEVYWLLPEYSCSGWLRLCDTWTKVKESKWTLLIPSKHNAETSHAQCPKQQWRWCTHYGALMQGTEWHWVHTRRTMEVKRTSWANYGRYRRVYILLVSTRWLILESSNMTQEVMRPVLLLVLLLWWVIRTHHKWLKDDVSWVIPNTTHSHDDSHVSMPFYSLLTNKKTNMPLSTYGKILPGSCALR